MKKMRLSATLLGLACSAIITSSLFADCTPPSAGLVSWWQGEVDATDTVGTNNGALLNGVSFTNGIVGQAFNFHGSDNVVIPSSSSLNPTNGITLECWAYTRRYSPQFGQVLISKDGVCAVARQYLLEFGDAHGAPGPFAVLIGLTNGNYYYFGGATTFQLNTWYHVALTYDGAALKLYVNGNLDGQMALSGALFTSSEPVRIGGGSESGCAGDYLDGLVDEPAIYNRALSSNEVAAIYAAGAAGKCTSPTPPSIMTQPGNQTVLLGGTAGFSVAVRSH
jgi:hypothetical protein